ncbi:MAG: hypothetical protein HUU56_00775 [Bdellovibrionaceae bacterium]|nr:hypothetical protein [Pseudobdellovibrionaceae bacterium]
MLLKKIKLPAICLFSKNSLKRYVSIVVAVVYILQVNAFAASAVSDNFENIATGKIPSVWTSDLKDYFATWDDFANRLEKNEDLKVANVFGLQHQRVDYISKGNIQTRSLDKGQLETSKPSYTSLKYSANPETREFIIEAITGADTKGNNGSTIARHVFQGYDVATVVADNIVIVIVEKNGKISVIPKSLIIHYGFEAPIPVFRNVNGTAINFSNPDAVKGEFLTIGSKPISKDEWADKSFTEENYEAGQLTLWEETTPGIRKNLVKLPMISLLNFVNIGLRYLNLATQLVTLDKSDTKEVESLLKEMSEQEGKKAQFDKIYGQVSEHELSVMSKYSSENIKKSLQAAKSIEEVVSSPRDKFTMEEWVKENESQKRESDLQYQQALKEQQEIEASRVGFKGKLLNFFKKRQVVDPDDFKPTAQNYQKFLEKNISPLSFHKSSYAVFKENVSKVMKSKAVTFLLIGAPIMAFYTLPYFYDKSETLKQVQSLSFLYEHIIPDVLKDQAYRTPLIISTVIQIGIIPLIYLSALGFKNLMLSLAFVYQNSQTPFGLKVKDFAKRYRDLSTTQVLLTMNVRFFSMIVTPYWKVAIEGLLGQRTFFSALNKDINPFKRVKKDSEIGKLLGLDRSSFVGLHQPLPVGTSTKGQDSQSGSTNTYFEKAQRGKEVNLKIQEILSEQKQMISRTAWLLATKTLTEKYQLDPVTLSALSEEMSKNKKITTNEIERILNDEKMVTRWEVLTNELTRELAEMSAFDISNLRTGITEVQFAEMYSVAKAAAEKVSHYSEYKLAFKKRFLSFKKSMVKAKNWMVNVGDKESKFLKQVIPGKYTAQQVNQDFPTDQVMVSGISGTIGDMANLNKKAYLMADSSKLLYTSDAQLFNTATNIYGHLIQSASTMSLLFDSISEEKETRYEPREYIKTVNNEWSQSLGKSSVTWLKHVSNPYKSDIGGLAIKRYVTKLNTIFAGVTFTVISQVLLSNNGFTSAFKSFFVGLFLAHKSYAFPWDFVQAGNRAIGEINEENKNILRRIQYQLSMGIKEKDIQKSNELIEQSLSEIMDHYTKNNPKAIEDFISTVNTDINDLEIKKIIETFDLKKISAESMKYLGLFVQLVVAQKINNKEKFEEAKTGIIKIYNNNYQIDNSELNKLNAMGFLTLTQTSPPVPTKENGSITWITSVVFGAILTTVLSTYLAPLLVDPNFLTQPHVVWKALLTCIEFTTVYYLALGKRPWELYREIYQKGKTFFQSRKGIFSLGFLSKKENYKVGEGKKTLSLCLKHY